MNPIGFPSPCVIKQNGEKQNIKRRMGQPSIPHSRIPKVKDWPFPCTKKSRLELLSNYYVWLVIRRYIIGYIRWKCTALAARPIWYHWYYPVPTSPSSWPIRLQETISTRTTYNSSFRISWLIWCPLKTVYCNLYSTFFIPVPLILSTVEWGYFEQKTSFFRCFLTISTVIYKVK